MIVLDKIKDKIRAFLKRYTKWYQEAKGTEKKAAEPPETKVAEAPEKRVDESRSK